MSSCLDAALAYIREGYSVIPVRSADKRPQIKWEPFQQRKATSEEITAWWQQWPDANIGIVCGAVSGITVVDVDGEKGRVSARGLTRALPPTRVVKTPHGHHLYYAYTPDLHTGAGFLDGLDVRNDGGYVVAPPSMVDGVKYVLFRDVPIVAIGEAAAGIYRTPSQNGAKPQADPGWVTALLREGAVEHHRNASAIRLAGYFHSKGLPEDIIQTMLLAFGQRCKPPMAEHELLTVVRSAIRYAVAPPMLQINDAPEMEDQGYRYILRWPTHGLRMDVEHVAKDKDAVRCLLTLSQEDPTGVHPLYGPITYNLVGSQDRSGMLRYLKEYKDLKADEMLQNVSRLTLQRFNQTSPLIYLTDVTPRAGARWCLYPLILEGHINILFGDGGSGKSLIALASMMSVHSGEDLGLGKPDILHRGCYLDWEFEPEDHRERMIAMCHGDEGLAGLTIMYKRCTAPIWEMVEELLKDRADHDIDFLVLDSALLAAGGEPEKADTVRKVFTALREIKMTTLIIAHTTHDSERERPFGSTFWHNMARNIWKATLVQEENEQSLHIMLKHTKFNTTKKEKPIGYHIQWAETGIIIKKENPMGVAQFIEKAPLQNRVAYLLMDGAMTPKELAEDLNAKEGTIRQMFARNKRLFQALEDGKWGLATG